MDAYRNAFEFRTRSPTFIYIYLFYVRTNSSSYIDSVLCSVCVRRGVTRWICGGERGLLRPPPQVSVCGAQCVDHSTQVSFGCSLSPSILPSAKSSIRAALSIGSLITPLDPRWPRRSLLFFLSLYTHTHTHRVPSDDLTAAAELQSTIRGLINYLLDQESLFPSRPFDRWPSLSISV